MSEAAVRASGLRHRWAPGAVEVLRDVSLELRAGSLVGVVGPNGAGKSTLLRCLAGLLAPVEGRVTVGGVPLMELGARERARCVAFVPQHESSPEGIPVREFVALGRAPWTSWSGVLRAADAAAVDEALDRCRLRELASRACGSLSGGERRRCQIARALAQRARFLVLDEPLASLDVHQQVAVGELLRARADLGEGVIASMHELNLAAQLCDRVVLLRDGAVIGEGPPEAAMTEAAVRSLFPCELLGLRADDGTRCFVPRAAARH